MFNDHVAPPGTLPPLNASTMSTRGTGNAIARVAARSMDEGQRPGSVIQRGDIFEADIDEEQFMPVKARPIIRTLADLAHAKRPAPQLNPVHAAPPQQRPQRRMERYQSETVAEEQRPAPAPQLQESRMSATVAALLKLRR